MNWIASAALWRRPVLLALLLVLVVLAALPPGAQARPAADPGVTRLGISGDRFTINGRPTFLLGVSYFDARFWREDDLAALQRRGYNLIRIWLDWRAHSFFDARGQLTDLGRTRLRGLVAAADRRGLVVDVTILDTDLSFGRAHAATAVQQVAAALAGQPNVLYDLVNEFNHPEGPWSVASVARLASTLRAADGDALYGVSSTGGYLVRDPAQVQPARLQAMLAPPLASRVLIPHLPRTADWAAQTGPRVRALRQALQQRDQQRPIYLQEEARRGHSGLNPDPAAFLRAARDARAAGAAGWVFHTDAGYALDQAAFMDALDPVERAVLADLPAAVGLAPGTPPAPPQPPQPPPAGGVFHTGTQIEAEDARSAAERGSDGNAGTAPDYPNRTGLDINRCYACANDHSVQLKWAEWAGYPVVVPGPGRYRLRLRVVTTAPERTLRILVDGRVVTGALPVPPSARASALRELTTPAFPLAAGTRQIAVLAPQGLVVDWLRVEPVP